MNNNIEFDPNLEALVCNDNVVALRIINNGNEFITESGFMLTDEFNSNGRLGLYQIVSIGKKAKFEYGVDVGDYVYADRLSVFYKSKPICLMVYTNMIARADSDGTIVKPLRNMIFVKADDETVGGGIIKEDKLFRFDNGDRLKLGRIFDHAVSKDDFPDFPFDVGDHILLTKNATFFDFGGKENGKKTNSKILIYKPDAILCKID